MKCHRTAAAGSRLRQEQTALLLLSCLAKGHRFPMYPAPICVFHQAQWKAWSLELKTCQRGKGGNTEFDISLQALRRAWSGYVLASLPSLCSMGFDCSPGNTALVFQSYCCESCPLIWGCSPCHSFKSAASRENKSRDIRPVTTALILLFLNFG